MRIIFIRNNKNWIVIIAGHVDYFPGGLEIISNRKIESNIKTKSKSKRLQFNCKISVVILGQELKACKVIGSYGYLPIDMEPFVLKFKGANTGDPFPTVLPNEQFPKEDASGVPKPLVLESNGKNTVYPSTTHIQTESSAINEEKRLGKLIK